MAVTSLVLRPSAQKAVRLGALTFLAAVLAIGAPTRLASATPVTSLFNTGVATNDLNGNPLTLVTDNSADPHYQIISAPAPDVSGPAVVTIQGQFPFVGAWSLDDSTSKWISPHGDENGSEPVGIFIYQTTFDLTGFDPNSAQIFGSIWSDNSITDIVLNSFDTHITASSFSTATPFSINTGFVPGLNTVDFYVYNDVPSGLNPSGLRVEMNATANAAVPEPASLGVLVLGALGLVVRRRR